MKQLLVFIFVAVFALNGTAQAASLDNFTINDFDVSMYLSKDSEGHSLLKTTETITAEFTATDQNHGLERVFVKEFDNHGTDFEIISVRNGSGDEVPYSWNGDALRMGDKDKYVHGIQTYIIDYTQKDVTRYFANTGKQEFYWDAIGTDWRVPIANTTVTLNIDESLETAVDSELNCYVGVFGANKSCAASDTSEKLTYSVSAQNLQPREGMTISLGFKPNTFAEYQPTVFEKYAGLWLIFQVIAMLASVIIIAWLALRLTHSKNRTSELGTIIPEYLPPKNFSVTAASKVITPKGSVFTAQLLDLAVRHYIKISEVKKKTFLSKAEYELEVLKPLNDLKWEEQEIIKDAFGSEPKVGARLNLKTLQNNSKYLKRTSDNEPELKKLVRGDYKLKEANDKMKNGLRRWAIGLLIIALLTISPVILGAALVVFDNVVYALATDRRRSSTKTLLKGTRRLYKAS